MPRSILFGQPCGRSPPRMTMYALFMLLTLLATATYHSQWHVSSSIVSKAFQMPGKSQDSTSIIAEEADFVLTHENRHRTEGEQHVLDSVKEILRLGNASQSSRGRHYRSLICCITRNDLHLREFVVRNLLSGFAHIVIYDNNQVEKGMDHDVREMLAPFVSLGAVTLVPWQQNSDAGDLLANEAKNDNSRQCVETYGRYADWVAVMDTDEIFHLRRDPVSAAERSDMTSTAMGILPHLLNDLEHRSPNTCGVRFPWRMMYGEHRFLKPHDLLLMDAYRRVCKIHDATKLLFRPEWSNLYGIPHGMSCTNPDGVQYRFDDGTFRHLMPEYTEHSVLLHYYQKSLEEWLVKLEQSIPPYIRYIPDSYDHVTQCLAGLTEVTYMPEYVEVVKASLQQLRIGQGQEDGGHFLGALPEFAKKDFTENPGQSYSLYLYCKLKVAQRQEWDEEGYLSSMPEAEEALQEGNYVDGLQHFLNEGFIMGARGVWRSDKDQSLDWIGKE